MDNEVKELPSYKLPRAIRALQISAIAVGPDGDATLMPFDTGYPPITVPPAFTRLYSMKAGGYYVLYDYEDTPHAAWLPQDTFETTHTVIRERVKLAEDDVKPDDKETGDKKSDGKKAD